MASTSDRHRLHPIPILNFIPDLRFTTSALPHNEKPRKRNSLAGFCRTAFCGQAGPLPGFVDAPMRPMERKKQKLKLWQDGCMPLPASLSLGCGGRLVQARAGAAGGDSLAPPRAADGGEEEVRLLARVVVVVGANERSPFLDATWQEVLEHMARRVAWIEPGVCVEVFTDIQAFGGGGVGPLPAVGAALESADVVVGVAIRGAESAPAMQAVLARKTTAICFDSRDDLERAAVLGGVRVDQLALPQSTLASTGIWQDGSKALKVAELVRTCWSRRTSDDVWFSILALVNAFVADVAELRSLRAAGLDSVVCMVQNCRKEVFECFSDPDCRAAIDCLNDCGPTDQVCSYRCIVSHESPKFEAFSLCVLQKHGCLGLSAEIRPRPAVLPMAAFRGAPLTHETAEGIFTGWLGREGRGGFSWRVVAGQNAAYDQFPCQFQIYYRGKARGSFWYDPVFKVRKLDGDVVWRRRHYRVRRAQDPGTFNFSVLDNGVISEEFWRIVDATDDLSWGLFYYSGAAKAAGQSYTGAILVSPDGQWPGEPQRERILAALESCGIKEWELYFVDNASCDNPPLGLPSDAPEQPSLL